MITKLQAESNNYFHYHNPNISIAGMSEEKIQQSRMKCHKWRRNGKTKLWKTRLLEFKVPIKYGLYSYGYLTQENADKFFLPEDCQANHQK